MVKIDDFTEEDKISSDLVFWNHKEEKELIGIFDRWESDSYGEHIVVKVNEEEIHLPNLTALNGKFKKADVKQGYKVKIVSTGEKKAEKSGRMYQDFDVFVKKE